MNNSTFCPEKVYYSTTYVRDISGNNRSALVKIGERRKNIAIVYDSSNNGLCLINGENEIIYKSKLEDISSGIGRHNGFSCNIRRTIKGFYIVSRIDYYRKINVGKDDQDVEEETFIVLDEDGEIVPEISLENAGIGQYSYELGNKLVVYDNVCYDIESLKPVFTIPNKYRVCSIIQNGLIYLEVPGDYKQIIVAVQNHEIIHQYSIEEFDSLKNSIQTTKEFIDSKNEEYLKKYGSIVFSNLLFDRSITISDTNDSWSDQEVLFNNMQEIDSKHMDILKYIYNALKKSNHPRTSQNGAERYVSCLTNRIIVLFYENLLVLSLYGDSYYKYRFFNLEGKPLHDGTFTSFKPFYLYDDKAFTRCIFIMQNSQTKEKCIIHTLPDRIEITNIPYNINVYDHFGYLEMKDNNSGKKWDCDYSLNRLTTKYVMCHVVPLINNYLYTLRDLFLYKGSIVRENGIISNMSPDKILKNGELLLPFPKSYKECIEEIETRHNNRPNYISDIEKVADYEIDGRLMSFYKFSCKPWAYCDENGRIYYDFDPDNIDLTSK